MEMQDRDSENYPDPDSEYISPYPPLQQDSPESTSTFDRLFGGEAWTTPTKPPPPGFKSLADYFNLGGTTVNETPAQTSTATLNTNDVTSTHITLGNLKSPTSATYFQHDAGDTPTSLPGFHVLPDTDPAPFPPFSGQQFQSTETSHRNENRHTGRGRPRGPSRGQTRAADTDRGRGRPGRGWKWAVKGTEHDTTPQRSRAKTPRRAGRPRAGMVGGGKRVDPGEKYQGLYKKALDAWTTCGSENGFLKDSDLETALENASLAVQANPEVWEAYALLYRILMSQKDKAEAEKNHEEALLKDEGACYARSSWAISN